MRLSIIIINWNSAEFTRKCISSIYKNTNDIDFEIIVVDNASYDSCAKILEAEFPDVIFIQSQENLGFSRANNLGYRRSSGDLILFLNPDTEIVGNALENMVSFFSRKPECGILGCKLLNTDFSIQMSCLQAFPTIMNQVFDFDALRHLFPNSGLWGNNVLLKDNVKSEEVDVVTGACLMIRRPILEKVGLFSEEYFMYSEDVDLCYKVKKAGFKIFYTDSAVVVHHGGKSSEQASHSNASSLLMKESRFLFFKKTRGKSYATIYRLSIAIISAMRLSVLVVSSPYFIWKRRSRALKNMMRKWCAIFFWSLRIISPPF